MSLPTLHAGKFTGNIVTIFDIDGEIGLAANENEVLMEMRVKVVVVQRKGVAKYFQCN